MVKNDDPLDKSNYRPIKILLLIPKVYERSIYNQLLEYAESFLTQTLCGFKNAPQYLACTIQITSILAKRP